MNARQKLKKEAEAVFDTIERELDLSIIRIEVMLETISETGQSVRHENNWLMNVKRARLFLTEHRENMIEGATG